MKRPHTVQHARSFSFRLLFQDDTNPIHFTFHPPPPEKKAAGVTLSNISIFLQPSLGNNKNQKRNVLRSSRFRSFFVVWVFFLFNYTCTIFHLVEKERKKEIKNNINPYCDVKLFNGYPTRMFIFLPQSKRLLIDGIEY